MQRSPRLTACRKRRRSKSLRNQATRARLPISTQMHCGRLPYGACRQASTAWTASKDRAAASNTSRGSHPIDHLVAGQPLSVHLGKAGRPAPETGPHHCKR
jgi:hypothetical protein